MGKEDFEILYVVKSIFLSFKYKAFKVSGTHEDNREIRRSLPGDNLRRRLSERNFGRIM